MVNSNSTIHIMTLIVNGLNSLIAEIISLDKKPRPTNYVLSIRNPLQI